MFTKVAWRAGYCIGRLYRGLRKTFLHSWERVLYDPIIPTLYYKIANIKNARFNLFFVLATGWSLIRMLQGDLDFVEFLDDLATNIIASHLYDRGR